MQTFCSNFPPILNHPVDTVTSFQVDKPELVLGYPHLFNRLNHLLCYRQTVRIVWRRPLRESSSSLDQPPPGSQCISLPQVLLVYVAQTAAFHSMLVLSEYAGHLHDGRESLAKLFRTHPYKIQSNNLIFQSKVSQGLVIILCHENGGRMVLDVSQKNVSDPPIGTCSILMIPHIGSQFFKVPSHVLSKNCPTPPAPMR